MKTKLILFIAIISFINCYSQTSKDYFDSGRIKQDRKDYIGAIADYTKSIESNPLVANVYFNRGTAKESFGDYDGAMVDYSKAIELNSKDVGAYFNRGNVKKSLQDYRGAIADYTLAIENNPKYAEAYYNRGIMYIVLDQKEIGCLDLNKASKLGYPQAYEIIKEYCN